MSRKTNTLTLATVGFTADGTDFLNEYESYDYEKLSRVGIGEKIYSPALAIQNVEEEYIIITRINERFVEVDVYLDSTFKEGFPKYWGKISVYKEVK